MVGWKSDGDEKTAHPHPHSTFWYNGDRKSGSLDAMKIIKSLFKAGLVSVRYGKVVCIEPEEEMGWLVDNTESATVATTFIAIILSSIINQF